MNLEIAQLNYLKRMKKRKERSKALLGEMRAIAFNKSKEQKPTAKRLSGHFFMSPTTKTPKRTSQLNFERG